MHQEAKPAGPERSLELAEAPTVLASSVSADALAIPHAADVVDPAQQARVFEALFHTSAPAAQVGRYAVLGTLGRGGMGAVYEAFDRTLDRRVAIKVLHRDLEERQRQRLQREAWALAKLSHPNVVQVYEVGEADGQAFIAMELVEGSSLRAWMRERPRPSWRECVDVFSQAGRGLAAAHARGLIHRDFKPDNALIGADGRVRVADFGLVRPVALASEDDFERGTTQPRPAGEPSPAVDSRSGGLATITGDGAILGTVAYMAPEQMKGREVDGRADQFALCVALHEAVYGTRPYDARTPMARIVALGEPLAEPETIARAPRWLYRVLRRGLAIDPAQRFESMDALLVALARPRTQRRWWTGVLVLGSATLAAVGVSAWTPAPCEIDQTALAGTWDDARRAQVRDALSSASLRSVDQTFATVDRTLEGWSTRWLASQRAACEATRVLGTQSEAMLDLRTACLERQRREADALVELLAGGHEVVGRTIEVLERLPDVGVCNDPRIAETSHPLPADPGTREAVLEAYARLSRIRALGVTRQIDGADRAAEALARDVEGLDYLPLRIDVRALVADRLLWRKRLGDAVPQYRAVIGEAEIAGLDELSAQLRVELVRTVVGQWGRPELQAAYLEEAEVAIARVGRDADVRRVELELARGALHADAGELEVALSRYRDGVELAQRLGAPQLVGRAHVRMADVFAGLGRFDEATHAYERARASFAPLTGHGSLAIADIEYDLGLLALQRGDLDMAEQQLDTARSIYAPLLEAGSAELTRVELAQAKVAFAHGDLDRARTRYERVVEGDAGPEVIGDGWDGLGVIRYYQGDLRGSIEAYRRAIHARLEVLGPEHPAIGMLHSNIGESLTALGDHEEALEAYARALEILGRALPSDHPDLAWPSKGRGESYLALGRLPAAITELERALELLSTQAGEAVTRAEVEHALARALAAHGELARASELAHAAQRRYLDHGRPAEAAAVAQWIETHPRPDERPGHHPMTMRGTPR